MEIISMEINSMEINAMVVNNELESYSDPWHGEKRYRGLGRFRRDTRVNIVEVRRKLFTMFVHNLQEDINYASHQRYFQRAGNVKDVFIPKKRRVRRKESFRFVRFGDTREAKAVAERCGWVLLWDRRLVAKNEKSGSSNQQTQQGRQRENNRSNAAEKKSINRGKKQLQSDESEAKSRVKGSKD